MTKEEIAAQLTKEVSTRFNLPESKITPDLDFTKDVDADSIDFVELVMELEDKYDIEISDDDAAKLITFQSTVDYLYDHVSKRS
ncbi:MULTISPECIES: acyl carrier protein [Oenococcus]|uniref:Acyl carrier protein n=1 Tax=Oenococcus kitaharae DSM 17330 TaxID=1045004 RepID=G9WIG4_9LACO|nr:acyl carrier protein [Oenococcus kitaharae]EHN58976.1 Acyl carrier protein [Oenococcus kitaharae DSM 17330]OEY81714.1 acyl carrier protein [Oenococcus kitaharae]OEY83945.1 acyl carrier protein [Oenococcus kitaharae]OEY85699.1 acyl carrier protein [Oenococcus kitaharae]